MATTNHTVDRLNQAAQEHRITTGELDPDGPALHHDDKRLLVGDEVVTAATNGTSAPTGG